MASDVEIVNNLRTDGREKKGQSDDSLCAQQQQQQQPASSAVHNNQQQATVLFETVAGQLNTEVDSPGIGCTAGRGAVSVR